MDDEGRQFATSAVPEAVDSDADLRIAGQRRKLRTRGGQVVAVIAAGGVLGAAGRYAVSVALPTSPDGWPWATFLVNASGCLLIGVLMVLIVDVWASHRLVRPFLGVGILGGYTTFSTYATEAQTMFAAGRPALAAGYLLCTALVALVAVQAGVSGTRAVALRRRRTASTRADDHGGTR